MAGGACGQHGGPEHWRRRGLPGLLRNGIGQSNVGLGGDADAWPLAAASAQEKVAEAKKLAASIVSMKNEMQRIQELLAECQRRAHGRAGGRVGCLGEGAGGKQ